MFLVPYLLLTLAGPGALLEARDLDPGKTYQVLSTPDLSLKPDLLAEFSGPEWSVYLVHRDKQRFFTLCEQKKRN